MMTYYARQNGGSKQAKALQESSMRINLALLSASASQI